MEEAEISQDGEVIAPAVRLMALVDPAAARAGSYVVDAAGAQGMQVGERNTQHNRFG